MGLPDDLVYWDDGDPGLYEAHVHADYPAFLRACGAVAGFDSLPAEQSITTVDVHVNGGRVLWLCEGGCGSAMPVTRVCDWVTCPVCDDGRWYKPDAVIDTIRTQIMRLPGHRSWGGARSIPFGINQLSLHRVTEYVNTTLKEEK